MERTRRSTLSAGCVAIAGALAGCTELGLGGGGGLTVENANVDVEDGVAEVLLTIEIEEPPMDVAIDVTTLDDGGETVDELSHEATLEGEREIVTFEADGVREEFAEFEYAVTEV